MGALFLLFSSTWLHGKLYKTGLLSYRMYIIAMYNRQHPLWSNNFRVSNDYTWHDPLVHSILVLFYTQYCFFVSSFLSIHFTCFFSLKQIWMYSLFFAHLSFFCFSSLNLKSFLDTPVLPASSFSFYSFLTFYTIFLLIDILFLKRNIFASFFFARK